jgi:hypothetical protein
MFILKTNTSKQAFNNKQEDSIVGFFDKLSSHEEQQLQELANESTAQ